VFRLADRLCHWPSLPCGSHHGIKCAGTPEMSTVYNLEKEHSSTVPVPTNATEISPTNPNEADIVIDDDRKRDLEESGPALQKASSIPVAASFPDGGLQAWLVVAGAFWLSFSSFGFINSFGIFSDYYKRNFLSAYSDSTIAWIGSTQLFAMFAGGVVSGRLFDMHGPRWMVFIGSIFLVGSKFAMAEAHTYYQIFLAQAVCFGVGVSCCFYPCLSAISHWFFKRRGFAISIAVAGSSLGGIFWPILMNNLFERKDIGFAWACRIAGFIDIPVCIGVNLTIKSRLGRRKPGPFLDTSFFSDPRFNLFLVGAFLNFWGNFVPFFFIQSLGIQRGMSLHQAFYLVSILNASSLAGRLVTGRLADMYGVFNMAIPSVFLSGIFSFGSLGVVNPAGVYVFTVLYGFTSGSFVAIASACLATICKDLRKMGTMSGTVGVFNAFAGLTGSPIAGAIAARQGGNFRGSLVFSGCSMVLGSFFLLLAKLAFKKPFFSKC